VSMMNNFTICGFVEHVCIFFSLFKIVFIVFVWYIFFLYKICIDG
jgi:hypothetical protein